MTKRRLEYTLGIDLGDRECHFALVSGVGGEEEIVVTDTAVIETTEEAFAAWFDGRKPMRVAVAVGTHARWIAAATADRGHEVIVCNPRKLPEIYNNPKKSDFIDAETLARIGHTDASKLTKLVDFTRRDVVSLGLVRARDCVVKSRARLVNHIRGAVKNVGGRIPTCEGRRFHQLGEHIPELLRPVLEPMMAAIKAMNVEIRGYDRAIERRLKAQYPEEGRLLRQLHGVGPTTALYFIAIIGDPKRFANGTKVSGYLGFGQKRHQSGERDPHLGITRAGAPMLRALLVGAARTFMSKRAPDSALRDWAIRRTEGVTRIQKNRIVIGLARKLGVLMHHLLKTRQDFLPYPRGGGPIDTELIMVRVPICPE
ncbi:MAG: IS110 family transposase [bacterium]|nr:IS110 family transposase [bacterium]